MSDNNMSYDAFISYRHAELDSFVAENIHHELEKFRLPKNLVKQRGEGQKTRIERVFRDRDELPIAVDLSANITEALERSDFLIVICTPRLKESMWCKSEIETFIALKGREHVLAVLAEGEPADSFPEQITKAEKIVPNEKGEMVKTLVSVEPLAADVRGLTKKEIKKKIKEEVMRLAAAMFFCNYDEIKQRHREQLLKKRIKIAVGVAAVSLVVGGVSAYQAITINGQRKKIDEQYDQIKDQYTQIEDQYDQIKDQYAQIETQNETIKEQYGEIEKQYNENLIKNSQMVASQAISLLNEGKVLEAKKLLLETYESAKDKLPDDAKQNLQFTLAEIIRCYDNGVNSKPVANFYMESNIEFMMAAPDYKYLVSIDASKNITIWDMEKLEACYSTESDFETTEDYSQNISFDASDNLMYVGANTVCKIDTANGKELWKTEIEGAKRFISIADDKLFVMAKTAAYVVDKNTGEILNKKSVKANASGREIDKLMLTSDGKAVIVASTLKDSNNILRINLKTLKVEAKLDIGNASFYEGVSTEDGHIVWESLEWEGVSISDAYSVYHCIDEVTLEEVWTKDANHLLQRMVLYKNKVVAYYSGGIMLLDPKTFDVLEDSQLERSICDITVSKDGKFRLLQSDGKYKVQNSNDFSFYEYGNLSVNMGALKDFKYVGTSYAVLPLKSKCITINNINVYKTATDLGAVKELSNEKVQKEYIGLLKWYDQFDEGPHAIKDNNGIAIIDGDSEIKRFDVNTVYVEGVYYDQASESIIVGYGDKTAEIRSADDYSLKNTIDFDSDIFVAEMDDEHFILGDGITAYVINRKTSLKEACIHGYISYDETDNSFVICDDLYDGNLYKIPFYSLDELVELAK